MLADKVGVFDAELRAQISNDDIRARLRRQLPSNIFVQYLAGPHEVRTGVMGLMLRLIALISLVSRPTRAMVMLHMRGKGDFGRGIPYGVAIAIATICIVALPLPKDLPI